MPSSCCEIILSLGKGVGLAVTGAAIGAATGAAAGAYAGGLSPYKDFSRSESAHQNAEVMAVGGAVIGAALGLIEATPLRPVRTMLHEMKNNDGACKFFSVLLFFAYLGKEMTGYAIGREIMGDSVDFSMSEGWPKAFLGSVLMLMTIWSALGATLSVARCVEEEPCCRC